MRPNGAQCRQLFMLQRSIDLAVVDSQPLSMAESADTIHCEYHS